MPKTLTLSKPMVGRSPFNFARSVIWYLLDESGKGFYISWVEYVTDTHGPECMAFKAEQKKDGFVYVTSWSEQAVSYNSDAEMADVLAKCIKDYVREPERPTCRLDLTDVETYGNAKVRIYECSECGRTCEEIYGGYERCPHCGAEVVRNGR